MTASSRKRPSLDQIPRRALDLCFFGQHQVVIYVYAENENQRWRSVRAPRGSIGHGCRRWASKATRQPSRWVDRLASARRSTLAPVSLSAPTTPSHGRLGVSIRLGRQSSQGKQGPSGSLPYNLPSISNGPTTSSLSCQSNARRIGYFFSMALGRFLADHRTCKHPLGSSS